MPEPLDVDDLIVPNGKTPGNNRKQPDGANQTDQQPPILQSDPQQEQQAEQDSQTNSEQPPDNPTKQEKAEQTNSARIPPERMEQSFTDDRIPFDIEDTDADLYDEDGEYTRPMIEHDGQRMDGDMTFGELDALIRVCIRKRGTPDEIAEARKIFEYVEGTLFEEMILAGINGEDGMIAKLLDHFIGPGIPVANCSVDDTKPDLTNFNVDDFV